MGSHGNGANQLSHGDLLISRELIEGTLELIADRLVFLLLLDQVGFEFITFLLEFSGLSLALSGASLSVLESGAEIANGLLVRLFAGKGLSLGNFEGLHVVAARRAQDPPPTSPNVWRPHHIFCQNPQRSSALPGVKAPKRRYARHFGSSSSQALCDLSRTHRLPLRPLPTSRRRFRVSLRISRDLPQPIGSVFGAQTPQPQTLGLACWRIRGWCWRWRDFLWWCRGRSQLVGSSCSRS